MNVTRLSDRATIEAMLRTNVYLHLYSLGDLDEFYWPQTRWYSFPEASVNDPVVLVYQGPGIPTVLALSDDPAAMRELVAALAEHLPRRFYAHVTPGAATALERSHRLESHGDHLKMALTDRERVLRHPVDGAEPLLPGDREEVLEFYRRCYPGNWFDPRMLETGQYRGVRERDRDREQDCEGDRLVSVAGIHVYSPAYGVAALGNIATMPAHRNRGLARRVTAAVCRSLLPEIDHIGLNVKADNAPAVASYTALGFAPVAIYEEFLVERR